MEAQDAGPPSGCLTLRSGMGAESVTVWFPGDADLCVCRPHLRNHCTRHALVKLN